MVVKLQGFEGQYYIQNLYRGQNIKLLQFFLVNSVKLLSNVKQIRTRAVHEPLVLPAFILVSMKLEQILWIMDSGYCGKGRFML